MRLSLAVAMASSCAGVALAPCARMFAAAVTMAEGHAGVVGLLVAHGAAVDQAMVDGSTPLLIAVQKVHADVVDLLVAAGANVNKVAPDGATPLFLASRQGHGGIVALLLAKGANVNDAKAAQNGHSDVVKLLIESGAGVDKAAADGTTPLHDGRTLAHAAALVGHAVAFDMFLGALGCDVMNQSDNDGWTPAHAAASKGHVAVLTSLLRAGCDTPLQIARLFNRMAARALRGRFIALFSLVASWALNQARGAGPGPKQPPRSTTTKRRREKSKPGAVRRTMHEDADTAAIMTATTTSGEPRGALTQSRTLSSVPPAADDNDEAALHIAESSQAGDAASHSVEEVKTKTCDDEYTRLVEAPPPPDDFDDATTVALLESLGLGSLLAVFREHEIDDSALRYLEPGDMRDMDIPLARLLKRTMGIPRPSSTAPRSTRPSSRPSCTSTARCSRD
ncbi:ankyrin repeat-containing domain protein [Pelagophyceae sp. CCMP2097]|nr:ankyrin repeat-containing domain protein [Pelagophyceae sp. CCMP2097]